jgi:hypothetical protein
MYVCVYICVYIYIYLVKRTYAFTKCTRSIQYIKYWREDGSLRAETCRQLCINPLTPELNPSAQRCLTRFFAGDFAS